MKKSFLNICLLFFTFIIQAKPPLLSPNIRQSLKILAACFVVDTTYHSIEYGKWSRRHYLDNLFFKAHQALYNPDNCPIIHKNHHICISHGSYKQQS